MCSSTLVNVCLFGFKQLLFLASSPKQLGRIWGGRDTLQFTLNPGLPWGPFLATSPPGHTLSGRAAFVEIVRIKESGKGKGGLRSSRTWCAPRRGLPGHAAFPVWLRPKTWAGEAPPLPGSQLRPNPALRGAPSTWGREEAETPDTRVGGGPGRRWRRTPASCPPVQGLPFILGQRGAAAPAPGQPWGWRGEAPEMNRSGPGSVPPSGEGSGTPGEVLVFPERLSGYTINF